MAFKNTTKTIPMIAQELNVRYALEGSVRRAGTSLRITAQLIDADRDEHLWADKYSGTVDDVFDLQERLSQRIVKALEEALSPGETGRPLASGAAYECYLRARHEIARWTESGLDRAVQHLEAGLEIEGENALLLASLAQAHAAYIEGGFRVDEETQNAAERYARRALALDPANAPAHGALGVLAYVAGDAKRAYVHLQRAVSLGTDDPNDLLWYVHATGAVGRTSTSRPLVERMVHTDPLNSVAHVSYAVQDYFEGRYEAALASVRVALRLDPTSLPARWWGVYLMAAEGQLDEAYALLDQWRTEAPEHPWMIAQTALVYAVEGRQTESMNLHARMLADAEVQSVIRSEPTAVLGYAHLTTLNGEIDAALEALEHGLELGLINYPFLAEKDRLLDGLRGDPRFQGLMERVKKEWEEFEDPPRHERN
jgi:tetratricopeptide (TPR) repeat protein